MTIKDFTDKQLIKELQHRIKNKAAINTLIAKKKAEQLQYELDDIQGNIETLEDLISDLEGL